MVRKINILKDSLRQIRFNKKNFIFLTLIISLITGIYLSLNIAYCSLTKSAKTYYDKNNIMDILISSSTGFTKDDYNLIKEVPNTNGVMMSKSINTKTTINNKDFNVKIVSISNNRNKNDSNYINRLILTSGKYPTTINEGLVFLRKNKLKLGDLITLKLENELKAKKIKIVGTVKSFGYSSSTMNFTLEKEDEPKNFIYLEEINFNTKDYNEVYITLNKNEELNPYSKKYKKLLEEYKKNIIYSLSNTLYERNDNKKRLIQNQIDSLQEKLNSYYNLDLPTESLNESIKQTSKELENEKNKLFNLKEPEIIVTKNVETKNFYDIKLVSQNIKKLAAFSPLILLPILCLLYLNFIASIVQEEKSQINVKKAIGFSFIETSFKYLLYVLLSSFIGVLIGGLVLNKIIFKIIILWFRLFFDIPFLCFKTKISSIILCAFITFLSSLITCGLYLFLQDKKTKQVNKNLTSKKVQLRKKLSLSSKMILNSIFKFKTRLILEISLIAFITTLLFSSFGIKDSINNVIKKQHNKIFNYDLLLLTNNKELSNIENNLLLNKNIKDILIMKEKNVTLNGIDEPIYLIIPKDNKKLSNFVILKNAANKKKLKLNNKGIIISKKLSKKLNKKENDTLKLIFSENLKKEIKITGVTSNYTGNYIYISDNLYKNIINNNDSSLSFVLLKLKDNKKIKSTELELSEIDKITSVKTKKQIIIDKQDKLSTINFYNNSLIVIMFVLTFIILYEITRYNGIKKKIELNFLNKLDLSDKKIISYVCKENLIITLIGSFIGIIIGSLITTFIVKNLDITTFVFDSKFNIISYLYCLLYIILVQIIISIFVYIKFNKNKV